MRRLVGSFLLILLGPLAATAQNAPPPFSEIVVMEIPMDEIGTFEESVRMVVEAAKQANLKPEFAWSFWQDGNSFVLVSELQSMAQLDDPEAWMRQFANTPGQATLMAAFEKMTGMHLKSRSAVMQNMADWSYFPADAKQPAWAEVLTYTPLAGSEQQLEGLIREAMGVLRSAAFPYEVLGSRTRVGEGVVQFAILYDDPAAYEMATARLEQNTAWQALGPRWVSVFFDAEMSRYRLRPEMSYFPGM